MFQLAAQSREIDRLTDEKEQMARILAQQRSDMSDHGSSFFNVVGDAPAERLPAGELYLCSLFLTLYVAMSVFCFCCFIRKCY